MRAWRPLIRSTRRALRLPVDAAHAEVFDLEQLLDALFRAFAADAAFLHAAEGRDLGRDDALVDADNVVSGSSATRQMRPMSRCRIGGGPLPNPPPRAGEGRWGCRWPSRWPPRRS